MKELEGRWAWLRYLPTPLEKATASREISCRVQVLHLSQTRIRLLLPQKIPVGAVLNVALLLAPEKFARTMDARVMDLQAQKTRMWLAECGFLTPLSQEELEGAFGDSARPGGGENDTPAPPEASG